MSTVAVNEITDEVGTGSPAFTNGLAQSDIAGALNATGTAPIYACRAWVNFDGTTATIRDSGNVSSITKNGTGDYTVNFATNMPDANYSVMTAPPESLNGTSSNVFPLAFPIKNGNGRTINSVRVFTRQGKISTSYENADPATAEFAIFR